MKKIALINCGKIAYSSVRKINPVIVKAELRDTTSDKAEDKGKKELKLSCAIYSSNGKKQLKSGYQDTFKFANDTPLVKELSEMWNGLNMRPKSQKQIDLIEKIDFNKNLNIFFK